MNLTKNEDNLIINKKKSSDWDEGIFIILAVMIILIPVVFYPYCIPVFDTAKNLVFQLLALVAFVLLTLKFIAAERLPRIKTSSDIPILIYLFFGSLSLIWSINIYHSIMALPLFLAGPVIYFVASKSLKEQKKIDLLFVVIISVGTGMGAYGILQYLGVDFEFWAGNVGRGQVFGLFGNVNYFAEYIILPLALTIGLFLSRYKTFNRVLLFFALIIMSAALFLTFTRGSYLAIALSIPIILFLYIKSSSEITDKRFYKKIILYFLALLILASAIIFIPHPLNQGDTPLARLRNRVSLQALTSGSSVLRRVAIWKFTWMMIEDYTLLGSGLGTYDYHSLKYQADFFARNDNRDLYPHGFAVQAHNEYLQLWSELGIIGLILFIWILFAYYHNIFKHFRKLKGKQQVFTISLAGGVTAVLVDSLFGFPLQLATSLFLFWLFIGLTGAQINIDTTGEGEYIIQEKENNKGIIKKSLLFFLVISFMVASILFLIRPFMARVYWYHGNQQIVRGNYNEAIEIYEKGLEWNPWQGEMYYDIGNILATKGISQLALEYYHKAEKFVDHHNLPQNIASLYIKRGEIGKAIPYLEKAIKYQQDKRSMLSLQLQLGNIYLTIRDFKKAEQHFSEAIKNNPKSPEAYYGLAGAYVNQGKKELTVEALQKVIELAPESKIAGYAKVMLKKMELEERE
jgi:O-antigen ligase/Tfp pilus assembly protein PilF